ncbi:hypothetical protein BRD01_11890 [Halobacteriales archaeon QS_8_65_32]|nr:MAG: hypothetical protein BRD01_11890 [Halobacteriales archaeon QS_8_65_32]
MYYGFLEADYVRVGPRDRPDDAITAVGPGVFAVRVGVVPDVVGHDPQPAGSVPVGVRIVIGIRVGVEVEVGIDAHTPNRVAFGDVRCRYGPAVALDTSSN